MINGIAQTLSRSAYVILKLPRPAKRILALVMDMTLCVLSVWLAFYLRSGSFLPLTSQTFWLIILVSVALALPIFIYLGLYRSIFRHSGLTAMLLVVRAMLLYGLCFSSIFLFYGIDGVPKTFGLIQPLLLFLFVGFSRAIVRIWIDKVYSQYLQKSSLPQALIYGAGTSGRQLSLALANSDQIHVVGFLDDDYQLSGHFLNGLPVYSLPNLAKILKIMPISHVLLALPNVSRQRRNEILNSLKHFKLVVRTLSRSLDSILSDEVGFSEIHDLEIDDLLGRESIAPNPLLLRLNTTSKTILITGAGGSIGSELCRQILNCQPKRLLLVDMCELALYQIHKELEGILAANERRLEQREKAAHGKAVSANLAIKPIKTEIIPLLASVVDDVRMNEIMEAWRPETVYHSAAYKHVPLVEHNPIEGIHNNVLGTLVCAESALRNGVVNFVLISTDKAVRPTNVMGATKRIAEMVLQALAKKNRNQCQSQIDGAPDFKTIFSIVRFGNVMDSSGSVVPLFREQIKNGGPITLTHKDVERYMMTIPEAAQLVIQAGAMGQGGDLFILEMGKPIKILDLAKRMVELSGLTIKDEFNPNGEIEVIITGLRSGEKLYEELLIGNNIVSTDHPSVAKAYEEFIDWPELEKKLNSLKAYISSRDMPEILTSLKDLVSGYSPMDETVDWVNKAKRGKP